jgi:hypothetical protein
VPEADRVRRPRAVVCGGLRYSDAGTHRGAGVSQRTGDQLSGLWNRVRRGARRIGAGSGVLPDASVSYLRGKEGVAHG